MTSIPYAWFYEDPFHSIFLASTTTLSVLSNGLLLFIIFTTESSTIGSYRYLLAVFAVSDILTSFAHALLQPIMHMTSIGAYFFPRHGGILIGGPISIAPSLINLENLKISQWISLAVVVNILYIAAIIGTCISFTPSDEIRALAPKEILTIYGVDLRDLNRGFSVVAIRRPDPMSNGLLWHTPTIVTLMMLVGEFGGTSIITVFCIWRITGVIKSTNYHFTVKTRKMQINLFRALLIQTAVPILFSYIPLGIILVFPAVTGVSLGAFGNVLFSITSIFPCIDALFVLFSLVDSESQ